MKVRTKIYLIKDSHNNKSFVVVDEPCRAIQICGMKDVSGEGVHFESEAHHIESFCNKNSIELRIIDTEEDFDVLWNKSKKTI